MADFKIKKWSGSAWVDAHPETTVGQIVATGTPSSTTFLRGDGAWASVDSGNQYVNTTGDTMTGTLEFTTSTTPIKLQQDHFVYRKIDATTEAVTNQSQAYILLCRNAANNDVNGTITMDRTSGLRHASFADILISSGSSSVPVGTMRSMSTAGSGSPTYKLVTLTYSSNSYVALSIYNPDSYYDTSGMYFTGRIKTTDTSNEFLMLPAGLVTNVADFGTNESHQINGDTIWHAGNSADPDTKVSKSGDTMTGELTISHPSSTSRLNLNAVTGQSTQMLFKEAGTLKSAITYVAGSDKLILYNEADRLTIDNSGNVGIGTTSPENKLHINSGTTVNIAQFENNYGKTFINGSSSSINEIVSRNSDNTDYQDLTFRSQGTAQLYLDTNGRIGIGTTSPSEKLHIVGNTRIEGDLTVNGSYTQIDTNTSTTEQWSVTNDGTGPAVIINQKGAQPIMDVQDDGVSALYIEDGGNVGIKTTNPTTTLQVAGRALANILSTTTANTRDKIRLWNTSGQYTIGMQSNYSFGGLNNDYAMTFQFNNDNDRGFWWGDEAHSQSQGAMALTTNGLLTVANRIRVGYGESDTTIPATYALDVSGNSYIDATSASATLTLGRYTGQPTIKAGTDDGGYLLMDSTGGKLGLNWYASDDVSIGLGGGNVGIGTSTPIHKLEVGDLVSTSTLGTVGIKTDSSNYGIFIEETGAGAESWGIGVDSDGDLNFYDSGSSTPSVVFNDGGNVGIGTTNPKTKLNVASGTSAAVTPTLGSAENSSAIFTNSVNAYGLNVMPSGSGDVHLQVQRFDASTSVYDLNLQPSGGNVGIGTTSPTQKLEVNGNINANELHLNDTNTILKEASSGNSVRIQTNSGYVDVGPKNTGWSHFDTDRGRFYFNKGVDTNGDLRMYSNNTTKIENSTGYIYELGNRVLTTASTLDTGTLDTTLIEIATSSNTTVDISGFSSSDAIVVLRARQFAIAPPVYVGKISDITTNSTFKHRFYLGSTQLVQYYRSATQIIFSSFATSVSVDCYELEVA